MKTFRVILSAILVILILLLAAVLYAAIRVTNMDTIYPNIHVGGIDVGGLTVPQAVQRLTEEGWEEKLTRPLTVTTLAGLQFDVDPATSGVLSSAEEMAEHAYSTGRGGHIFDRLADYLRCRSDSYGLEDTGAYADRDYLMSLIAENQAELEDYLGDSEYVPSYEEEQLILKKGWGQIQLNQEGLCNAIIEALKKGETELSYTEITGEPQCPDFGAILTLLHKEPRDARFTDDGRFEVIDEIVGCTFDTAQAEALWNAAAPAEEVRIPMDVVWPTVTGEELRARLYHDLLGACTTYYFNSTENRRSNIRLASAKINEYILYPGEVFSYNTVVGARTEEAGFLPAPAYVDGDVQDEIGGGACQVSSTLYAATLFAFLETVDRTCHMFPVHYMQLGTDATVTIPDGGRSTSSSATARAIPSRSLPTAMRKKAR